MSATTRSSATAHPARRLAKALAMVFVAGVVTAGCGSSDGSTSTKSENGTTASANDTGTTNPENTSDDQDEADTVLGYQVTAEPGTVLDVELLTIAQGVEQSPLEQTVTVTDEPWQMLFTVFVDSAEITVEITEGDTATVETIRGRMVDPEDPFGAIEVTEIIDTVEVTARTSATVAAG